MEVGPFQADVPVLLVVNRPGLRKVFVSLRQNPVEALLLLSHKDLLQRLLQVNVVVLFLRGISHKDLLQRPFQVDVTMPLLLCVPDKHVLLRLLHNNVAFVLFLDVLPQKNVFISAVDPQMALPPRSTWLTRRSAPASASRVWRVIVRLSTRPASRSRQFWRLSRVALVAFVALNRICWVALVALPAFC